MELHGEEKKRVKDRDLRRKEETKTESVIGGEKEFFPNYLKYIIKISWRSIEMAGATSLFGNLSSDTVTRLAIERGDRCKVLYCSITCVL